MDTLPGRRAAVLLKGLPLCWTAALKEQLPCCAGLLPPAHLPVGDELDLQPQDTRVLQGLVCRPSDPTLRDVLHQNLNVAAAHFWPPCSAPQVMDPQCDSQDLNSEFWAPRICRRARSHQNIATRTTIQREAPLSSLSVLQH